MSKVRTNAAKANTFSVNLGADVAAELAELIDRTNMGRPLSMRVTITDMIRTCIHHYYHHAMEGKTEEANSAEIQKDNAPTGAVASQSGVDGNTGDGGQRTVSDAVPPLRGNDAGLCGPGGGSDSGSAGEPGSIARPAAKRSARTK